MASNFLPLLGEVDCQNSRDAVRSICDTDLKLLRQCRQEWPF